MDGEEFFDRLYSQFCLHLPCHALRDGSGAGFVTEPANDGTNAVVLLTDEDLVERYRRIHRMEHNHSIVLPDARSLSRFLHRLPNAVTHVTFDPSPGFHRRYPVDVIRDCLDFAVRDA